MVGRATNILYMYRKGSKNLESWEPCSFDAEGLPGISILVPKHASGRTGKAF